MLNLTKQFLANDLAMGIATLIALIVSAVIGRKHTSARKHPKGESK